MVTVRSATSNTLRNAQKSCVRMILRRNSRVFCELCSQKIPCETLPVNSKSLCVFFKQFYKFTCKQYNFMLLYIPVLGCVEIIPMICTLHFINDFPNIPKPACRNGRRGRLKICCGQPRVGSSPTAGTFSVKQFVSRFLCKQTGSIVCLFTTFLVLRILTQKRACFQALLSFILKLCLFFILQQFLKNREAVKCGKIIPWCLSPSDHFKTSILMKKNFC